MTTARLGLKMKVKVRDQRLLFSAYDRGNAVTRSLWPRSSIKDSFSSCCHCQTVNTPGRYRSTRRLCLHDSVRSLIDLKTSNCSRFYRQFICYALYLSALEPAILSTRCLVYLYSLQHVYVMWKPNYIVWVDTSHYADQQIRLQRTSCELGMHESFNLQSYYSFEENSQTFSGRIKNENASICHRIIMLTKSNRKCWISNLQV